MLGYQRSFFICYVIFSFFIAGCATTELVEKKKDFINPPKLDRLGVYHKVRPRETIWRIAKTYNVAMEDIIRSNNILNIGQIEKGQLIFIPGVSYIKDVIFETSSSEKEFVWPVRGEVSRYFRQPKGLFVNKGIDIQTSVGSIVKAARTGRVVLADHLAGYGNVIILDHADGFYSLYAYNDELFVKLGSLVLKNTEMARVAQKEKEAFLHFEIRRNAVADNPLYYLPKKQK